jgi:hypothetical protein
MNSLVECEWTDIVGAINTRLEEITPQKCTTWGILIKVEEDHIKIASSIYEGEGRKNPTVDGTAIPLGCIDSIKRIK